MAATSTANVEKIVRRVLKQELDVDEKATLNAIQRVTKLLTDEVIPKLEEPADEEDADAEAPSPRARSFAASPPTDGPGIPEGEDPDHSEVPEAVTEAFEQMYGSLTQDRAEALATFFATVADELRGDEGGADDEDGNTDDEDAVSDDEGEADHG